MPKRNPNPPQLIRGLKPSLQRRADEIIRKMRYTPEDVDETDVEIAGTISLRRALVHEFQQEGFTVPEIMRVLNLSRFTVWNDINFNQDQLRRGISHEWVGRKVMAMLTDIEADAMWFHGMSEKVVDVKDKGVFRSQASACRKFIVDSIIRGVQGQQIANFLKARGDDGELVDTREGIFEIAFRERLAAQLPSPTGNGAGDAASAGTGNGSGNGEAPELGIELERPMSNGDDEDE